MHLVPALGKLNAELNRIGQFPQVRDKMLAQGIEMPPPPGSSAAYIASIRLVPWVLGAAAITGALAAIAAAILPGLRAARFPVVDALRHNI